MNEWEKAVKTFKEETIDPMTEFIKKLNKENNMEWKELQIDNLPPDILTGDYEFELDNCGEWAHSVLTRKAIISNLIDNYFTYRYRKPEPKAPTHEEIMTKWWKDGDRWIKIVTYNPIGNVYSPARGNSYSTNCHFIGLESAEIPPE